MERVISQEERIRRAEEIYNRRRLNNNNYRSGYVEREEKAKTSIKTRLSRKLIFQVLICLIIYLVIYIFQNSNYIFNDEVNKKIDEFLSYDIQFSNLYNSARNYFNSILKTDEKTNANESVNIDSDESTNETSNENINEDANQIEIVNEISTEGKTDEGVGGAEENVVEETKDQNQLDIEFIKANYSIIWPLNGVITSVYGPREETEIVTPNHYGIDIAGDIGKAIVAAMDGTVTLASSEGDYGKHIKIENGEVSTLYAHCSTLCVEEGANVKQGEKIAEVRANWKSYRTSPSF